MAKPLIIANWKCNPDSLTNALAITRAVEREVKRSRGVEVAIAPPFPFLIPLQGAVKKIKLAAQDMFWESIGPYTGSVSWQQLKHLGVRYVIIGHSERRQYQEETDEMINKKVIAALKNGLIPVLCVGEKERTPDVSGVVGEQLKNALRGVQKKWLKNLVVAYEPIWAISTQKGAEADTPENAFRSRIHIRKIISDLFDRPSADVMPLLYGGSVRAANIQGFLQEGRMDGALVGGASLDPEEFGKIVKLAGRQNQNPSQKWL